MTILSTGIPVILTGDSLPLPSGAATAALQTTGNTSLSSIDGKIPAQVSSGIPVSPAGSVISTSNSTTANLGNGGVFTGAWEEVQNYAEIRIMVFADQNSATNGLSVQQGSDGTNADIIDTLTISANVGRSVGFGPSGRYFRLVYTNGATPTTNLRIQVVYHRIRTKPSSQRPADATSNENDFEQINNLNSIYNGTTWDMMRGSVAGLNSTGTGIPTAGLVAQLDDTGTTSVTENQFAHLRLSTRRALLVEGVASGTAQPISGTVTANIGTGSLAAGTNAIGDFGIQYRTSTTGAGTVTNANCPATPAGQSIKGSAGRLLAFRLVNTNAATRWLKIFNATAVTPGTTSALTEIALPTNQVVSFNMEGGAAFSTGIMIMITGGQGLTNNTAVTLADVTGFTVHA